jgi:signal transduction histidine kinase
MQANMKNLDLKFEFNLNQSYIFNDQFKFERILFNLVSNAVYYTIKGSIRICIEQDSKNSELISICVIDTGIGID